MDEATLLDPSIHAMASHRDTRGRMLTCSPRRDLRHLNRAELACYHLLTDPYEPVGPGTRVPVRIEQERIPMAMAVAAIETVLTSRR